MTGVVTFNKSSLRQLIRSHKQLHKNVSLLKMLRNVPIMIKRGKP